MDGMHLMRYAKCLMVLSGVWRVQRFKSVVTQTFYKYYSFILQAVYSLACFLMCVEFFYLLEDKDITKLTDNIRITVTCSLAATKCIIFGKDTTANLIKRIIEEEMKILNSENKEERRIYMKSTKYIEKCTFAIILLAGGTAGFLVVSTTIVGMSRRNDPLYEKPMIFSVHFPFDQHKYYGSSLITQGMVVLLGVLYYSLSQIFYISVLVFVKAQLQILQHRFKNFDDYKRAISPFLCDIETMRMLIQFHQFILRFVKDLNEILKYLVLVEFLLSSINIASVAFQLIMGNQALTDVSFSVCLLIVLISQLLVLAWHANDIHLESLEVSTAIYEFPWYEKAIEVQDMVSLVILRSQKPLSLTIGPFGPLTTQTVITVINAAYSYVTIMTSYS